MTTTASPVQFLSPEEIATRKTSEAAQLRLAELTFVFRDRALRLRQLAAAHPMRDFLIFMADVADAQHVVLNAPRSMRLPSQEALGQAAKEGLSPLEFPKWTPGEEWLEELRDLLDLLQKQTHPDSVAAVLSSLGSASDDHLNQQAERLLSGVMLGLDFAASPILGAALQVYWTRLVARTQLAFPDLAFGPVDNARVCPCCGSQPVSSVSRIGGEEAGSRYLHCALCQTQWHMVRIKCSHCESNKEITYQELALTEDQTLPATAAAKGAVRAECCDDCGHYLKIVSMDKDPHVDPVADDLATVALDLLVSETGKLRHGVNYMLLWGEPAEDVLEHQHAGAP